MNEENKGQVGFYCDNELKIKFRRKCKEKEDRSMSYVLVKFMEKYIEGDSSNG